MQNVWTIYRREIAAYFNSPIAYIFILAFLAILSIVFFILFRFFSQQVPDLWIFFASFPWAFLIFIPAITMRLWSEEKKLGTLEVLLTMPIKTWEAVMAKFLSSYTVIAAFLLLTIAVPISVSFVLQEMDYEALVANYIGVFLIAGIYIAMGSAFSALTVNQVVAFVASAVVSALLCVLGLPWVIDWISKYLGDGLGSFVGFFGIYFHYENFVKGQISAVDVVYALSMIGLFLGLNNFAVESRKY